ncbi:MFS transporter [Sulfitobacter sp. F26204]|uniref:MFS transporter n=1 Tax=Sulfitobacter sp. F26204 TaxID=2996014 RepID=UPI00225DCFA8|nr:MFS transporter [Sulfitobacter sp. F26204]MCX7558443.1 MFS transporter [Sulfitobacter sp. F26204]
MSVSAAMMRNVTLYPWFKFAQNLLFWQAVWFLYFQTALSAAEAIMLYAVYDVATTVLEVPSGYLSDRIGRRRTLILACVAGALGAALIAGGQGFVVFAVAQVCLGTSSAFASGTDNAILYESLAADGRPEQVEAQETRGWRASLTGLALSAVTGGVLASYSFELAFAAGAVAMLVCLALAWSFSEPAHDATGADHFGMAAQWRYFRHSMRQSVLVWLFILSVLMYGFSHVPFVFGQPFIAQAMEGVVWPVEAPVVSGAVSAMMMLVSVVASLIAVNLRARIGLAGILLLAFAIQIGLIAMLALTSSALAIGVLLLRMVPNSFARPFIVARIQPLLGDQGRATYLSLQSFAGRLLFAGSLLFAAAYAPAGASMAYGDIQTTLAGYALAGAVGFALLFTLVRWARLETD